MRIVFLTVSSSRVDMLPSFPSLQEQHRLSVKCLTTCNVCRSAELHGARVPPKPLANRVLKLHSTRAQTTKRALEEPFAARWISVQTRLALVPKATKAKSA